MVLLQLRDGLLQHRMIYLHQRASLLRQSHTWLFCIHGFFLICDKFSFVYNIIVTSVIFPIFTVNFHLVLTLLHLIFLLYLQ